MSQLPPWDTWFEELTSLAPFLTPPNGESPPPGVNIVDEDKLGLTLLHQTCSKTGFDGAMKKLLSHPEIEVNARDNIGLTPLMIACSENNIEAVALLLQDSRVDASLHDKDNTTAIWYTCSGGCLDILRLMIASGKELDVHHQTTMFKDTSPTCLDIAKEMSGQGLVSLLEDFISNPDATRYKVRQGMGDKRVSAVTLFAHLTLIARNVVNMAPFVEEKTMKFFEITGRLAPGIQAIISNRVYGVTSDYIDPSLTTVAISYIAKRQQEEREKDVDLGEFLRCCARYKDFKDIAKTGIFGPRHGYYDEGTSGGVWVFTLTWPSAKGKVVRLHVSMELKDESPLPLIALHFVSPSSASLGDNAGDLYYDSLILFFYTKNRPSLTPQSNGHPLSSGTSTIKTLHMLAACVGYDKIYLTDSSTVGGYETPFMLLRWAAGLPSFYEGLGYHPRKLKDVRGKIDPMKKSLEFKHYREAALSVVGPLARKKKTESEIRDVDKIFSSLPADKIYSCKLVEWVRDITEKDITDWLAIYSPENL